MEGWGFAIPFLYLSKQKVAYVKTKITEKEEDKVVSENGEKGIKFSRLRHSLDRISKKKTQAKNNERRPTKNKLFEGIVKDDRKKSLKIYTMTMIMSITMFISMIMTMMICQQ